MSHANPQGIVPAPRRYLVTGALGCIGAWTVRRLLEEGSHTVAFDLGQDDHRLRLAVPIEMRDALVRVIGDITDRSLLERTIEEHGIEAIVHLAGLQVPACRADPVVGAGVNVVGTLTVFEAAKRRADRTPPVVYASSVAAYDLTHDESGDELSGHAQTHYGVFKRTNEGSAHVYWVENGIASIGLRPYVVYGPGRDQGITSEPTRAMLAAARGEGQHIGYGGRSHLQYVEDVAQSFINASRSSFQGAATVNLGGSVVHMRDVITAIETVVPDVVGRITFDDRPLPFPDEVSVRARDVFDVPADTPLLDGVRRTIAMFREYLQVSDSA